MNIIEIIKKKRDGKTLSKTEIEFIIHGYLNNKITDYQMSSFLMAVYFKGLNGEETFHLTDVMLKSGKTVDLSFLKIPKVDKHSTGGVGDKTSLILAPQVASCGIAVPMISGRSLAHTGGTLDKLESIPYFNVNLSIKKYIKALSDIGVAMIGQTTELAPADKKIYSLRDVTATVDNISLITASIMSKKLAEGAEAIVFDVKIGCGANLPQVDLSVKLAKTLISTSKKFGKKAVAVLTDMNEPLGYKIGNWLEVEECLEVMSGKIIDDLCTVNNTLAGAMIYLGGKAKNIDAGIKIAEEKISDGSTLKKFREIVSYQGGDLEYLDDWNNYKRTKKKKIIKSKKNGYISEMNALLIGSATVELGCGRKTKEDKIVPLAGIILNKKCGNLIRKNEKLCELYTDNTESLKSAEILMSEAITISSKKPKQRKLILDILY